MGRRAPAESRTESVHQRLKSTHRGLDRDGSSLFRLGRIFSRRLDHIVQQPFEVFKTWRRNNNGVASTADVFGNPEETSAWIFLEREDKSLPFNLNLVRF